MATGLKYYFGIDFGTTNSATVGYVVMDQKPEAVKYGDEEGRPIPSVVAIDKTTGAVFTGRDAWDKKMELSESCEYISSVKTILDSEQIKTIAGREWTAVDVASEVFKYLKANVRISIAISILPPMGSRFTLLMMLSISTCQLLLLPPSINLPRFR